MSDDPNRPDPSHELEVDISAFLPEGSRLATTDDVDDADPVDEGDATDADGDGGASVDAASSGGATASAAPDFDDGWGTDAPAPEIPAWARDGLSPVPAPVDTDPEDEVDRAADGDAPEPEPVPVPNVGPAAPAAPAAPEVDTTVLTRIEGELADVDAAIEAIDAGDLTRSPLLTELLAAGQAPPANQTPPGEPTN